MIGEEESNPLDLTQVIEFESQVSENSSENLLFESSSSSSISSGGEEVDNIMTTEPSARRSVVRPDPGAGNNSVASLPALPGNSAARASSVEQGVPSGSVVSSSPSLGATTISTVNTAAGGLPPLPTVRVPAPSGGGAFRGSPINPGGVGSSTKSSIVVPAPGRNKLMFTATTDVSDADIEREAGVLCSRDNRGSGSNFRKNRENAVRSMDPKFGVTHHFVSSLAGEAEEGDTTKDQQIQDSFSENLAKVGDLVEDMVKYDINFFLMCLLCVLTIVIKRSSTKCGTMMPSTFGRIGRPSPLSRFATGKLL